MKETANPAATRVFPTPPLPATEIFSSNPRAELSHKDRRDVFLLRVLQIRVSAEKALLKVAWVPSLIS
jgi:hypothetical protein